MRAARYRNFHADPALALALAQHLLRSAWAAQLLAPGLLLLGWCVLCFDFNQVQLLITHTWIGDLRLSWRLPATQRRQALLTALAITALLTGPLLALMQAVPVIRVFAFDQLATDATPAAAGTERLIDLAVAATLAFVAAREWFRARLYAPAWNSAGLGEVARTRCDLNAWEFTARRLGHWLLLALTLGLAWPWTRVSAYRIKCESITVWLKEDPDQLAERWRQCPQEVGSGLMVYEEDDEAI